MRQHRAFDKDCNFTSNINEQKTALLFKVMMRARNAAFLKSFYKRTDMSMLN